VGIREILHTALQVCSIGMLAFQLLAHQPIELGIRV